MSEYNRIGIYGGSFDPVHNGHIHTAMEVADKFSLDQVFLVPAAQNPLKDSTEAGSDERFKMLNWAIEGYEEKLSVDAQELERKGKSYSIETLRNYAKTVDADNLHLILGMDTFDRFDEWRDFEEILEICNLVVTSRPGVRLPRDVYDLPAGVGPHIALYDRTYIELKTGRNIQFITVPDIPISSTELRKKLRTGKDCAAYLSLPVERFIQEHGLYEPIGDKLGDSRQFLKYVADQLDTRRAIGMRAFDLSNLSASADYTLVASATSTRHAKAMAEYLHQAIKDEFGVLPVSLEGVKDGRWALLDYGAIIIHIFYDHVRGEYKLEELWAEGQEISSEIIEAPTVEN